MKRYAIFACFDAHGQVAEYVRYYLQSLKEVADFIVFVSDGVLQKEDKIKLQKQVDMIIDERHGEYDFGSYKRGFMSIENKLKAEDELILCNDSCFGPLIPFKDIFKKMFKNKADMWGMIDSNDHLFLMSFFLVLKGSIFTKSYFKNFLKGIQKEAQKEDVVLKYEQRLSQLVRDNGGTLGCWLDTQKLHYLHKKDLEKFIPQQIISFVPKMATSDVYGDNNFYLQYMEFPFIKKLAFKEKISFFSISWKDFVRKYNYSPQLISKYLSERNIPLISFGQMKCRYYWHKFKKFLFYKKIKNSEVKVKILGLPVYKKKNFNQAIIISVVRDWGMYNRCVWHNPNCSFYQKIYYDNNIENLGIPTRYNDFLDHYDYSKPCWFVFCHEDFQLKQNLNFLNKLAPDFLYGPIGAKLDLKKDSFGGHVWGQILNSDKNGQHLQRVGFSVPHPQEVETFDCQCIIVHSSVVKKHHLRFDEQLKFDLYVEDLCIDARENHQLLSKVIPLKCQHYSFGNIQERFWKNLAYLQTKYKKAKARYSTVVCDQTIGGISVRCSLVSQKRPWWYLFFQKKQTKSGKTIIKICKIPVISVSVSNEKTKYRVLFFKFSKNNYLKLKDGVLKRKVCSKKTILFFDMYLGGGTNSYFKNYITNLPEGNDILRVQNTENSRVYVITLYDEGKKYRTKKEGLNELFDTLSQLPVLKIIISNLISWKNPLEVLCLIKETFKKNIPISLCVHDYFSVCPFYTLMKNGHYCGGPQKGCEKCFLTNNGSNERQKDYANQYDILTWRQSWGNFLQNCVDEIVVFSESSKKIMLQAYPKIKGKITIVPHKVPYLRPCHILPHKDINICVVGGATEDAKGMYVLQEMEKIIARKTGINLIIVGCYDKTNSKTIVTGMYERDKLPDILEQYQGDVVMLPSIAPETFSYVVSEGMMMELPVACFNIGAPVERVSKYKKGLIISRIDAQEAIDEMIQLKRRG